MTDKPQNPSETTTETQGTETQGTENQGTENLPPYMIHAQYLKDLSLENKAMLPFLRGELEPKFNHEMEWALTTTHLEDENFEVVLQINVVAHAGAAKPYIIEVFYGAVVSVNPQFAEHTRPILQVEIPTLLFPYIRQIITDCALRAGYPPLYIPNIDFRYKFMNPDS